MKGWQGRGSGKGWKTNLMVTSTGLWIVVSNCLNQSLESGESEGEMHERGIDGWELEDAAPFEICM